jgi:hypothetical protein
MRSPEPVIRGFPLQKPKQSGLLDALYAQLNNDEECAITLPQCLTNSPDALCHFSP